jgi:hypothetical protein
VFLKTVENIYAREDLDIEQVVAGWKWGDLKLLMTRVWCVQEVTGDGVTLQHAPSALLSTPLLFFFNAPSAAATAIPTYTCNCPQHARKGECKHATGMAINNGHLSFRPAAAVVGDVAIAGCKGQFKGKKVGRPRKAGGTDMVRCRAAPPDGMQLMNILG